MNPSIIIKLYIIHFLIEKDNIFSIFTIKYGYWHICKAIINFSLKMNNNNLKIIKIKNNFLKNKV